MSIASESTDREIVQTRTFDAPRERVFDAWTDPQQISRWWGPDGFTTTTHEMDVRPGGVWRFIMHGPDGTDYRDKIVFQEVVRPERLVYVHGDDDAGESSDFHVTVTFENVDGKTHLTMRSIFASVEERDRVVGFGAVELGQQTLRHLAEHLASQ